MQKVILYKSCTLYLLVQCTTSTCTYGQVHSFNLKKLKGFKKKKLLQHHFCLFYQQKINAAQNNSGNRVSIQELNHLAAILHVHVEGLIFMK